MLSLICAYAQNRISSKLFWGEQGLHIIQKVIPHFMLYAEGVPLRKNDRSFERFIN